MSCILKMQKNAVFNQEYVYGIHPLRVLLQNRPQAVATIYLARQINDAAVAEILANAKAHKIAVKLLARQELNLLLPEMNHQGVAAQLVAANLEKNSEADLEALLDNLNVPSLLLILDSIQDPHNLGACLRVANAAGVHGVITTKDKAAGLTSIVHKISCGASLVTPFFQVTNLARTIKMLKERGIWIYGTEADVAQSLYSSDLKGNVAIVIGAEGEGMRRLTRETCDFSVSIPMLGSVASLNVGVAAGICLFEAVRQRIEFKN